MRLYIVLFFFIVSLNQWTWANNKTKPHIITPLEGVWKIRKGDTKFFKQITYKELMVLSKYIRDVANIEMVSPIKYLLGEDNKWYKGTINTSLKGLLNKDPRIRLFSMHLLFKMSIKREWIEKDILRTIENETVDQSYYFTNIYGYTQYKNIKDWLFLFLNIDNQLILLSPEPNSSTYKMSLGFDWVSIYGAYKYNLYINDILYYSGKDTFVKKVNLYNKLPHSSYRWTIIVKDINGKIIKSSYALFDIKKLDKPYLTVNNKLLPNFKWQKIKGVTYYKLYIYKKNDKDKKHKLLYSGNQSHYDHKDVIEKGEYLCYLVAGNSSQSSKSDEVTLTIGKPKTNETIEVDKPLDKSDELDFNIEEFKKLEEDPLSKKGLEDIKKKYDKDKIKKEELKDIKKKYDKDKIKKEELKDIKKKDNKDKIKKEELKDIKKKDNKDKIKKEELKDIKKKDNKDKIKKEELKDTKKKDNKDEIKKEELENINKKDNKNKT